jgi:tetratricopeptide (TPR) repeat protein
MKIKIHTSMNRLVILTIAMVLIVSSAFSQENKLVEARNAFLSNDLSTAQQKIDEATNDPSLNTDYQMWYWRGAIYKELYKATEKGKETDSKNRVEAVKAYQRAIKHKDKVHPDTLAGVTKSLKFLASTLYNDAVVQLDTVNYEQAVENYELYNEVIKFVAPQTKLADQNIKFSMKLATIYVALYDAHAKEEKGVEYFDLAKKEYGKIIEMRAHHLSANYNLGILFYNRAVNIIQDIDYGIDLEALSKKEEECVTIFLQALPYMTTAYELDPKRKETLIALVGIYYSLNDQELYERYKKELDELD